MNPQDANPEGARAPPLRGRRRASGDGDGDEEDWIATAHIVVAKLLFPLFFVFVGIPTLFVVVLFRAGCTTPLRLLDAAGLRRPLRRIGFLPDDM